MEKRIYVCPSTDPISPAEERFEERLIQYAKELADAGADFLHCDIMDGKFVERSTFDAELLQKVNANTTIPLDVHLMTKYSKNELKKYVKAGANIITLHVENFVKNGKLQKCALVKVIKYLHKNDCLVGVSLKPKTELEILLPILPFLDLVLVMSVEPGKSGQEFLKESFARIAKLDEIRKEKEYQFLIEVDGGVNLDNLAKLIDLNVDMIVSGNYIFKSENKKEIIKKFKNN